MLNAWHIVSTQQILATITRMNGHTSTTATVRPKSQKLTEIWFLPISTS